ERALQRQRMKLASAAAGGADDGVVAARRALAFGAGAHGGGPEDAMEQAQLEQRGDVAVDRDEIDAHASAPQLAVQLARSERTRRLLDQLEQRPPRARHPPAPAPQSRLGLAGELHGRPSSREPPQMQRSCIKRFLLHAPQLLRRETRWTGAPSAPASSSSSSPSWST